MMKKIIALTICLLMLVPVFASCGSKINDENRGAQISMYLTDPVYNFDPARAYGNESALKVVSLMFDNLFVLNENGKVEKSLAKKYTVIEDEKTNEIKMQIELNKTCWSDGTALTANDVVYAWKRILDPANSYECAALLYDIKYAKEAKEGTRGIDEAKISAPDTYLVEVEFNEKIDYDKFILNLTSYALAPVRQSTIEDVINPYDWAKKPTLFTASGPFKLREAVYEEEAAGIILERNDRYYRNAEKDALDKSVTPYRLIVDYTMTDEEIMDAYENGKIFYVGDIPLSVRGQYADSKKVKTSDALSTHTYMLNHNAVIRYYNEEGFKKLSTVKKNETVENLVEGVDGDKIFADANVRKALSLALDREAIVNKIVFAEIATGIVPNGVFNTSRWNSFRQKGEDLVKSDMNAAKELLKNQNIDATKYMFAISVAAYDDVHMAIAEEAQKAWTELGFHVAIKAIDVVTNEDKNKTTDLTILGVMDDIFMERYDRGEFEVASIDLVAYTADAFSVLAPFSVEFSGRATTKANEPYVEGYVATHVSGYNSDAYNQKIAKAHAADKESERAKLLHEAEKILMDDMPVIPVIFNVNATLTSKELSKGDVTYYGTPIFTKLKLKNYEDHLPVEETESESDTGTDSDLESTTDI